ncbi:MAG TPA: ribose-phosphate diphosphokinase [Longimicrobium sp.]|nr:ribose-phosphate diphosphokinase [Longimicrobium sp.]
MIERAVWDDFVLFAGSANPALAQAIASGLGVELADSRVEHFPDGELSVTLLESVRRKEVYVIQPTAPPVNDNLMELLAFADGCRRSAAARVTAVVPYFGYARSDRRRRREPITASMVAALMQAAGIDHVLSVDLHTPQIEGFFQVPVDSLNAVGPICDALAGTLPPDLTVVSPDAGRVKAATEFAQRLEAPLAIIMKRRESGTRTEVTHLVGNVKGRACLIVDDMISTGGTLVSSIHALRDAGAREFHVAATHGLLVGDACERLEAAGVTRVVVTDTVRVPEREWSALHVVSLAPLLAEAIRRMVRHESVSEMG